MSKLRLKAAFLAIFLLTSCHENQEEEKKSPLNGYDDHYVHGLDNTQVASQLGINSIYPASGPVEGGTAVDIIGSGFTPNTSLFIGEKPAENVVFRSASLLSASTPGGDFGAVNVTVVDGKERATLTKGFKYFRSVKIFTIDPLIALSTGGTRLNISGQGFVSGTQVSIGDVIVQISSFPNENTLVITTPPLEPGYYDITVANLNGESTHNKQLLVVDPLYLQAVSPAYGSIKGGTEITISGSAIFEGTSLWLGDNELTISTATDNGSTAICHTPPAKAEGVVNLKASNRWGENTMENAFVYLDDSNSDARLVAVLPQAGPASGGNRISLIGYNLPKDATIHLGNNKATCLYISSQEIHCNAPAGSDGPVDISINNSVALHDAYYYVDIAIAAVSPNEGSVAGGQLVTVTGHGFKDVTKLFFDGQEAEIFNQPSTNEIVARIPKVKAAGEVDVVVSRRGVQATLEKGFTYYNHASRTRWTSGGKINGTINGYVYSSYSGRPVKQAYVLIGTDTQNGLGGYTDDKGLITISAPGLKGPLDVVTASKTGYSNHSYVKVDARDMVFWLSPSPERQEEEDNEDSDENPDAETDGDVIPIPDHPVYPSVKCSVSRLKSLDETTGNRVIVFATQNYYMYYEPTIIKEATMLSSFSFEYMSNVGEQALVALSGDYDKRHNFIPKAMGIAPFLFFDYGRDYEVDILIDTPLDSEVEISFGDNKPDEITPLTRTFLTIDLGGMGYLTWPRHIGTTSSEKFNLPSKLPHNLGELKLYARAGVYADNLNIPMSEVRIGQIKPQGKVDVSPLLGVLQMNYPEPTKNFRNDYKFIFETTSEPPPYPTFNEVYTIDGRTGRTSWVVFSRGDTISFDLPNYSHTDIGSPFDRTMQTIIMQSFYVPELDFNDMDEIRASTWISRSYNYTYFDANPQVDAQTDT